MLSEILKLLDERGAMSLTEMSIHFQTDLSAMEGMLDMLEHKGRIERLQAKCSGCSGCAEIEYKRITGLETAATPRTVECPPDS